MYDIDIGRAFFMLMLALAVGFYLRAYLLTKYRYVGKDTFYHLVVSQIMRKEGRIPKKIDQFVVPEEYDYPPLFHLLLSRFDKRYHERLQILSPVFDILTAVVIYTFCAYTQNHFIAFAATMIYLVTPFTLDTSYNLGPRSMANLFLVLSITTLIIYTNGNSLIALGISIVSATMVLLTHRLTTQSLVFVLLSCSVVTKALLPILVIILAILLSIVVTKGGYLNVLKGHLKFITTFGKKTIHQPVLKTISTAFSSPIYVLFNIPIIIFIIPFLLTPTSGNGVYSLILIWAFALTILSILWIMGEGIRHMTNAVGAYAVAAAIWSNEHTMLYLYLIILISLVFCIIKIRRLEKDPSISGVVTDDMMKSFEYIRLNKSPNDILLCLPLDLTYNAAYFTECKMLQSSGGFAKGLEFNQKLHGTVKEGRLNQIIEEYNPQWIMLFNQVDCNSHIPHINQIKIIGDWTIFNIKTPKCTHKLR